jgi:hypothetical protein
MRTLVFFALLFASSPAAASQPTGADYGRWHVVSVPSLSGGSGDDAFVQLDQGDERNRIEVEWLEGGPVRMSISIKDCQAKKGFAASSSVPVQQWLKMSNREVLRRLRTDISAWLSQAELTCGSNAVVKSFRFKDLRAAAFDFSNRLRLFAGANSSLSP